MKTDLKILIGIGVLTLFIFVGGVFFVSRKDMVATSSPDNIVSKTGLHWHSKLTIYLQGKKYEIPPDVGRRTVEQPIHTHETDGVIHLEFSGLVAKDDIKLGQFFKIWGREFNANCIFDKCNGSEGKVKMTVNGLKNQEFENYSLKDGDQVEIRYE